MIITNNISSLNAERNYRLNVDGCRKSQEKLSSGYRINKAADDAAGLTISEKMREQIRGLNQGTENAKNGISWVQTGDGALNEVHDIIHRMRELSVQSLNDTNTKEDRAALQAEFDALQSEIDRITGTTQFNTKNIFRGHEPEYYQMEGNRYWEQSDIHTIDSSVNDLTIRYRKDENATISEVSFTVPEGVYTTQELIDEIEDAMDKSGAIKEGLMFEYTDKGTCNINYEGGSKIEGISGGLSYLINDMYKGGSIGALVGTTIFHSDSSRLGITTGQNDNMSFQIQDNSGKVSTKEITIPEGRYTRQEIIDILNNNLADTTVKAVKYSTGIKLQSDDSIITGFKGNMFKIEGKDEKVYTSVFYDNVMYGNASMSAAEFKGGAVVTTNQMDKKYNHYEIDNSNNTLSLSINGAASVKVQIKNGSYTVSEMKDELNKIFKDKGIGATVSEFTSGGFAGLKITSDLEGSLSNVSVDKSSSAYSTLFTDKGYTSFIRNYVLDNETRRDVIPVMTGGKKLNSSNLPLKITSSNNQFALKLNGKSYTIKLTAGTYNTADDLKNELDKKLNGASAAAGYKDKVEVSVNAFGKIVLSGKEGSGLTSIDVAKSGTNGGYDKLFVGEEISYKTTTVSSSGTTKAPAKITLNKKMSIPAKLDNSNNKLTVNVNGTNKTVVLPTGNSVSKNDIINAINTQLAEKTITTTNTFPGISKSGSETKITVTATGRGSEIVSKMQCTTRRGSSKDVQGSTELEENIPTKVTMEMSMPDSIDISDNNNTMIMTINDKDGRPVTKSIVLDSGNYSRSNFVKELQNKINAAFGKNAGSAQVSIDDSKRLVFEARLDISADDQMRGEKTSISINTDNSSFIKELCTTRKEATAVSSYNLASSIKIDSGSNDFSFDYTDENGTNRVDLELTAGTYTQSALVAEINKQLVKQGIGVKASLSNAKLALTTTGKGKEYAINYSTQNGGSSSSVIFGKLDGMKPAVATAECDIQDSIKIDNSTNEFKITANGKEVIVKLDNGTYTRSKFAEMLNKKLKSANAGVTVALTGKRLTYTTDTLGNKATISMNYNSGGTSMSAIYGETKVIQPGVKASFNSNNQLVLTGTQKGGSLSVTSDNSPGFQEMEKIVRKVPQQSEEGYISNKNSSIDGADITQPLTIDKWNKNLKFTYTEKGVSKDADISLDEKTYTFSELEKALSEKLNAALGKDKLDISVTENGVNIKCIGKGSNYRLSSFSGGFYDMVICTAREYKSTASTSGKAGGQRVDSAFTIGRQDVNNSKIHIEKGMNDEFTFDFTYGGTSHPITLNITEGVYSGKDLVKEMQNKLNQQLKNMGLSENLIEVGIGGVSTGVAGSNDSNALCLKLSKSVALPAKGEYIIDGVRGSAAFYIFYQSQGKMIPAYTKGSKDITEGMTISDKNNNLGFHVDGTEYEINLDAGNYSADELIDHINEKLNDENIPVVAKMDGKNLKLSYKNFGGHTIDHVTGNAKNALFYQENSGDGESDDIKLQLSGDAGDASKGMNADGVIYGRDYMSIERPIVNTTFLGINSIAITKPKYANKALGRLDKALDKVSEIRSMFGAVQNRLEHAVNSNNNTEENTSAAESLIRDSDMAEEMVSYSRSSILQQAAQAMIAQSNSTYQGVMALLQ